MFTLQLRFSQITRFLIPYGCEVRHVPEAENEAFTALVTTRAKSAAAAEVATPVRDVIEEQPADAAMTPAPDMIVPELIPTITLPPRQNLDARTV